MLQLVCKSNSNISITKSIPNYANKKIQQKKQHQMIPIKAANNPYQRQYAQSTTRHQPTKF